MLTDRNLMQCTTMIHSESDTYNGERDFKPLVKGNKHLISRENRYHCYCNIGTIIGYYVTVSNITCTYVYAKQIL